MGLVVGVCMGLVSDGRSCGLLDLTIFRFGRCGVGGSWLFVWVGVGWWWFGFDFVWVGCLGFTGGGRLISMFYLFKLVIWLIVLDYYFLICMILF